MKDITLHDQWFIKAPLPEVFAIVTDFERFPEYFPKVAEFIHVTKREGNHLEMSATVRSFGQTFPVTMKAEILPGNGFFRITKVQNLALQATKNYCSEHREKEP